MFCKNFSCCFISIVSVALLTLLPHELQAKNPAKKDHSSGTKKLTKINTDDVYRPMDINNVFNYYSNNGDGSFNPFSIADEGFEFPIGSNDGTCVFEDGLVWTTFKRDTLRCGGSTYNHGLQAGRILTSGTANSGPVPSDPSDLLNRPYRVRPDIRPTTNRDTIALEESILQNTEVSYIGRFQSLSVNDLLNQYWNDWNQWPADQGAPYTDVNQDGRYEPAIDIPGYPGADQTIWMVMNDLDTARTMNLYASTPVGIEVQRTIWAYNRTTAVGDAIFVSYTFINKSGVPLDTMYVAQWVDPDVGYSGDDAIGCDTTRSLGFDYNGEPRDANYADIGLPPPSVGFDFLQGPIVPGAAADTAIFEGRVIHGYKNLPMTAFSFFLDGNITFSDPPLDNYGNYSGFSGSLQWYNLMRGLVSTTGQPFPASVTGGGKYCFPGDPVTGKGPIYLGSPPQFIPGDVRMALCSGPFTMQPGDTQEVVVGALAGMGADYLSSIAVLKNNDDFIQRTYDFFFRAAKAPPAPVVHIASLDKEIVLSWGDPEYISRTENSVSYGATPGKFTFEGYNVYQYPRYSPSGAKRVATFDLIDGVFTIIDSVYVPSLRAVITTPTQFGTDTGIFHSIDITADAIAGGQIVNDRDYYFAVTAYNYNPDAGYDAHALESAPVILTVRPQSPQNGVRIPKKSGDTLRVTKQGTSDGYVLANVVDPTILTGDAYVVGFNVDSSSNKTYWDLTDATKGIALTTHQVQSSNTSPPPGGNPAAVIVNGVSVQVFGPPPGMNPGGQGVGWNIPSGKRDWSSLNGSDYNLEGFNVSGTGGAIGMGRDWGSLFGAGQSTIPPEKLHKVMIKFSSVDSNFNILNPGDPNVSMAYRFVRQASSPLADSTFLPVVNPGPGYAFQDRRGVPLAAFDEDNNMQQLDVGFLENNATGGKEDGKYDPPSSSLGINNISTTKEYFFIFGTNYSATVNNPNIPSDILNDNSPLMWLITATMRSSNLFSAGDEFEIIPDYVNAPGVTFSFTTSAPTQKLADEKADIAKINVFPNPYFGFNRLEADKYTRWVRFTHLPSRATIRIFNLAGILVRTLVKNDPTQFADWDLLNEHQLPIGSGMYIAYIDCGSLGTKTLKFAVIPEQQFLDHY